MSSEHQASAPIARAKLSDRKLIDANSPSDSKSESADDSNYAGSEAESDTASPSDRVEELAWKANHSETAESEPSRQRGAKRKAPGGDRKTKQSVPGSMLAFAQDCLATVNHSIENGYRADALEVLRQLLVELRDGAKDAVYTRSTANVVAEAVTRMSTSVTSTAMSFNELNQVAKLATMVDGLCVDRPTLQSPLNR